MYEGDISSIKAKDLPWQRVLCEHLLWHVWRQLQRSMSLIAPE